MGTTNYNFELFEKIFSTLARNINTSRNTAIAQIDAKIKDVEVALNLFIAGANQTEPCRFAATGNVALTGLQTIDSVVGVLDDRTYLFQQTDPKENGLYLMKSGAWVRTNDTIVDNLLTTIREGSIYQNQAFIVTTNDPIVIGVTNIVITPFPTTGSIGTAALNMNANLPMNSNKITLISDGTIATDAVNKGQMDTSDNLRLLKAGGTMSGAINMGSNLISNVTDPVSAQDAATRAYVLANAAVFNGGEITTDLRETAKYKTKSADDGATGSDVIIPETLLAAGSRFGGRGFFPTTPIDVGVAGSTSVITDAFYSLTGLPANTKAVNVVFGAVGTNFGTGDPEKAADFSVQISDPATGNAIWQSIQRIYKGSETSPSISFVISAWIPIFDISGGVPRIKIKKFSVIEATTSTQIAKYAYVTGYSYL